MYDKYWITEWDKAKWVRLKLIWEFIGIVGCAIRMYWLHGVVVTIGFVSMIKYFQSIPIGKEFFEGELLYLVIGILMPLIFTFGLREGMRTGYGG